MPNYFSESGETLQARILAVQEYYLEANPTCGNSCPLDASEDINAIECRIFVRLILEGDQGFSVFSRNKLATEQGLGATNADAIVACVDRHRSSTCVVRFSNR